MLEIITSHPILATIFTIIASIKLYNILTLSKVTNKERLDGKTVLITGANAGLGKATALELARRGAMIIMACRNLDKAKIAKDEIIENTKNDKVVIEHLDLGSFKSIRNFSKVIHDNFSKIDILINNAGVYGINRKTEDGLDIIMQTNHFGPFLLTILLLDLVKQASPSRIIFVSSIMNLLGRPGLNNLNCEKYHLKVGQYSTSKLANIMTANCLARKLQGTGVTVNSLHPGVVKTDIIENIYDNEGIISYSLSKIIFGLFAKTIQEGISSTVHLATDPGAGKMTGKYFAECKVSRIVDRIAFNKEAQDKLWKKSEEYVNLKPEERLHLQRET